MRATRPGPAEISDLRALLEQDVETNLFLLDILLRRGLPMEASPDLWLAAREDDNQLSAVLYASLAGGGRPATTTVAFGDPAACRMLGSWLARVNGTRMIVGPRRESDAAWEGLGCPHPRTRFDQRLYVCDRPAPGPELPVMLAREDDLAVIARFHATMLEEDLHIRSQDIDRQLHEEQVLDRIRRGRCLVARQGRDIVFTIDIGTYGPLGAQVGGTFVPRNLRGQGIATRAMRAVCRRLLEEVPRVTLHVNEANRPAVHCYEVAGFQRRTPFRLMVL